MDTDFVTRFWALIGASIIGLAVVLYLLVHLYRRSAGAQLRARAAEVKTRYREVDRARSRLEKCETAHERLRARADSVKPRTLTESEEAVLDARSLLKIAEDQVMVAETRLREIIVEEFPPKRQDGLRQKYLR